VTAPPWMVKLQEAKGAKEYPGSATSPLIAEMHAALGPGVESDEIAWCSSAIAWSFARCGMLVPKGVTRSARSWLHGQHLVTLQQPCRGAIAVLWREDPQSWKGHVGLVECLQVNGDGELVTLLGGNQGNSVSVQNYDARRVLAYMWPRNFNAGAFPLEEKP